MGNILKGMGSFFIICRYGDQNIGFQKLKAFQLSALQFRVKVGISNRYDRNAQIVKDITDSFLVQLHPCFAGIVERNSRCVIFLPEGLLFGRRQSQGFISFCFFPERSPSNATGGISDV